MLASVCLRPYVCANYTENGGHSEGGRKSDPRRELLDAGSDLVLSLSSARP